MEDELKDNVVYSKSTITLIPNGNAPDKAVEMLKPGPDGEVSDEQILAYCAECRAAWRTPLAIEGLQYWVRCAYGTSDPMWRKIRDRIAEIASQR